MGKLGIYLDEEYTNALIVLGYNENLISSYTGGKSTYERDFLGRFTKPNFAQIALQNLVLYGKCYLCPHFDNFHLGDLEKNKILEIAKLEHIYDPEMRFPADKDEVLEMGLLYPVLTYLQNNNINISSETLKELIEKKLERYNALLSERFELKAKLGLIEVALRSGNAPPKWSGISSRLKNKLEMIEKEVSKVIPIFKAFAHIYEIAKISANHNVPALWNCSVTAKESTIPSLKSDDILIAGIYFSELRSIKIKSLSNALDLLNRNPIIDFRNEVFSAIEEVKEGRITVGKVSRKIQQANKILEACKLAGKAGTIITVAGISALAYHPLSPILTIAGISLLLGKWAAKRKWKWALISNV